MYAKDAGVNRHHEVIALAFLKSVLSEGFFMTRVRWAPDSMHLERDAYGTPIHEASLCRAAVFPVSF